MNFRPCIDIHNGKVKQIVGASLKDECDKVAENFVSDYDAAYYAEFYKKKKIKGGHIILLNAATSKYYVKDKEQAIKALQAYPNGLQVGGGVTAENASDYIRAGASHVIVTSYVFENGRIQYDRLQKLRTAIGKDKIVLDLSCRKKNQSYYVVTNRWQSFTEVLVNEKTLSELASYCDEFLIHAVDVEGKVSGIEVELVTLLGKWNQIPITYAGGVHSYEDLEMLKKFGKNHIDVTIGSALDLFGGDMKLEDILQIIKKANYTSEI